jgi:hypothetical protein
MTPSQNRCRFPTADFDDAKRGFIATLSDGVGGARRAPTVIASEAKQSRAARGRTGLLRRKNSSQ